MPLAVASGSGDGLTSRIVGDPVRKAAASCTGHGHGRFPERAKLPSGDVIVVLIACGTRDFMTAGVEAFGGTVAS